MGRGELEIGWVCKIEFQCLSWWQGREGLKTNSPFRVKGLETGIGLGGIGD